MSRFLLILVLISVLGSCSNTPELETGEIKTLSILQQAFQQQNQAKQFVDARTLINRKQIDEAKVPILFVELPSGQNGTLTPYPGQGIGQTWLGADGATITLQSGVLKASRGMGDDLMGSTSSIAPWSKTKNKKQTYRRELSYISGNNKILKHFFECDMQKTSKNKIIKIWDVNFEVNEFEEDCRNRDFKFKNTYYLDNKGVIRRSLQHHSKSIGSILIERLDR